MAGIHIGIGLLMIVYLAGCEAGLAAPATAGPATRLHLDPIGLGEFQQRIGARIPGDAFARLAECNGEGLRSCLSFRYLSRKILMLNERCRPEGFVLDVIGSDTPFRQGGHQCLHHLPGTTDIELVAHQF